MEDVIERVNNTTYGLAAGVLTKNIDNALTFATAVEVKLFFTGNKKISLIVSYYKMLYYINNKSCELLL